MTPYPTKTGGVVFDLAHFSVLCNKKVLIYFEKLSNERGRRKEEEEGEGEEGEERGG
jgi:hypothetical protein